MAIETSTAPPRTLHTRSQSCPLCGHAAEYYFVSGQTRKHFLCRNCTQFQISVEAEAGIENGSAESRSSLAQLSQAHPQGATLVIVQESTALSHEYVENSQLPG
jgi:hypothetical protein